MGFYGNWMKARVNILLSYIYITCQKSTEQTLG